MTTSKSHKHLYNSTYVGLGRGNTYSQPLNASLDPSHRPMALQP